MGPITVQAMLKQNLLFTLVGAILGAVLWPSLPVSAGGEPIPVFYSVFDESWGDWDYVDIGDLEFGAATAAMGIDFYNDNCAVISTAEGSERNFTFTVDGQPCVADVDISASSLNNNFVEIGLFQWAPLDGQGNLVALDCVEVSIDVSTTGDVEAGISFSNFGAFRTSARQRIRQEAGFSVRFGVENVLPGEGDGVWTVEISVGDCVSQLDLGLDPDNILRRGEDSTLPDTL